MQTGITVGTNAITGTLKHVTGYTGFSSATAEQSGNYLALHFEAEDADSITVELVGGKSGEVTLDSDGIIILLIANNDQKVRVRAYKNGVVANVQTYSLTGLTLSGE